MTGQSLLDRMELLNAELQLQPGEADVTRGLLALNVAQDYYESVASQRGKLYGGQTGTVTTSANTETTAFPTGVYRIDGLQYIDPTTNRPGWDLVPIQRTGGHASRYGWFYQVMSNSGTGYPYGYYTNGTSIYWSPLPSGTHTIRWYGFQAQSDITASETFAYQDIVALPLASFAVRILKAGIDDNASDLAQLAVETFTQTLDSLSNPDRSRAVGFQYSRIHTE